MIDPGKAEVPMASTSSPKSGRVRFALITAALLLGIIAQTLLSNGHVKWAVTPYVVAFGALILAMANSTIFPAASARAGGDQVQLLSGAWRRVRSRERVFAAAGITGSALFLAFSLGLFPSGPPNTAAWYMYAISMVLLLASLPGIDSRWSVLLHALKERPQVSIDLRGLGQWAVLALIVIFALIVRLYDISELPPGVWYDEAANLMNAFRIQEDPGNAPVFSRVIPVFYLFPATLLIRLIGLAPEAVRLTSVAFSVAGVVAVFLLARRVVGPGLVAAFVLAVTRWDINFSRIGMVPVTMSLFTALTAYLTLRALESRRTSDFGFAGAAMGLGFWFYASFQLFPLVIAFILFHHLVIRRPKIRKFAVQVAVFALVALAVAAPLVQFAYVQPEEYFSRFKSTSVWSIMPFDDAVGQVKTSLGKHARMFHFEGDSNPRHNLPGEPMLDLLSGALMLFGIAIALMRWRHTAMAMLPVWLFVMVLPGVMTLPFEAPQALRSIGVLPAVALLVALPLTVLWRVISSPTQGRVRQSALAVLLLILTAIAYGNINTYFGRQAADPRVFAAFSTDGTLIGRHMLEQQARGYTLMASRQFKFSLQIDLSGHRPGYEVIRVPVDVPIDAARVGSGVSIYLEPREAGVFSLLRAYYPEGHFEEVRAPGGGDVLYYLVLLTREQLMEKQGLRSRYTLPDGSVTRGVVSSTEVAWQIEVGPDEIPLDLEWSGALHVTTPGEYVMELDGDADVQVSLDGEPILTPESRSIRIDPAVGLHDIKVKGRVEDRSGVLRLLWRPPDGELGPIPQANLYNGSVRPLGLAGRFFENGEETELADATRVTPSMDTFWYDPVLKEPYFAVWEGVLGIPSPGEYRFEVKGFGDIRLFVDGAEAARYLGGDSSSGEPIDLDIGNHDVRVEYSSPHPPSEFDVIWTPPGEPAQTIPVESLRPDPRKMFRIIPAR